MADVTRDATGGPETGLATALNEESDFSPRKIRIATVCLVGMLFGTSLLPFGAAALVMLPMTAEFGWSRTEFSLSTTFLMWFGALSVPYLGRLTDRLGARPVILCGTGVVGLVTLAMAFQSGQLWQFYACYALLGIFGSSGVAYSKVTAALFTKNRGKALAIFGVESTIAASILPAVNNALIVHYGWRGLYVAFGCVILGLLPLLYLMLEEPGRPRGRAAAAQSLPPGGFVTHGMTSGQAMRDRTFWLLVLASVLAGAPGSGMMTHMVAAIMERGFSQTTAANVLSAAMLVGVAGTLTGGFIVDRFQTAKVNIPFSLSSAAGVFLLWSVSASFGGVPLLIAAMALHWAAFSAALPMGSYFRTRYFGLRSFTEISGFQSAILAISMGFAPPLIGRIYDQTHSYDMAFALMIGGALCAAAVYLVLGPYRYAANAEATPMAAPAAAGTTATAPALAD